MANKKVILGVAAGVAALAVAGVYCKRKGYLDNWTQKAGDLGSNLKNKFGGVADTAKQKLDQVMHGGSDMAGSTNGSTGSKGASKSKATNTGNTGINPATA